MIFRSDIVHVILVFWAILKNVKEMRFPVEYVDKRREEADL